MAAESESESTESDSFAGVWVDKFFTKSVSGSELEIPTWNIFFTFDLFSKILTLFYYKTMFKILNVVSV